ncbi:MAG: hypothetical protein A3H29_06950 [Acidobacteria bacterium RIFCSPLOWO2_02_FULL_67_21]|nr:MAG: hypothetical protein A3H29_06950 [Acidobacteria bacterium RIFCSPLOWO2_02_FULL_67_21]
MVLAIDQQKIDEQLAANPPVYRVTPLNLDVTPIDSIELPIGTCGTVSVLPADVEQARARLLELRERLLKRGVNPLVPDDLDRYIDDIRGS